MKNVRLILMTTGIAALLLLGGCNNNQQNEHGDRDNENHEMMETDVSHDHSKMEGHKDQTNAKESTEQMEQQHKMHQQNHTGSYAIGDQLPNKQVCMVNDAYMAKDQIPVPVNGKTYYGCCQMCVKSLNEQETARMATDPQTGEKVDKTEAYIVLLDNDGAVAYFKDKANAEAYATK